MSFLSFYQKLPTLSQMPSFYVPGYTESLKTFKGVRVVPDLSFLEGFPRKFMSFVQTTFFPFYFIPLYLGENVYGFTLKGTQKMTPNFTTIPILPGQSEVEPGQTVILSEGFKDVYLFRIMGIPALPCLTSVPPAAVLKYLSKINCSVIFVPDNDKHQNSHILKFQKTVASIRCPLKYEVFSLKGCKDLGGFFDSESERVQSLINFKVIQNLLRGRSLSKGLQNIF